MKWPTTKSSSFSRLFWFFKSNPKCGNSDEHFEFAPKSKEEGRFYSMDEDDLFWRLSFGDERIPARNSTGGINEWTLNRGSEEECRNFNEMVDDIKRMRESRGKQGKTGEGKTGDSSRKRSQKSKKSRGFDDESNLQDLEQRNSRKSWGFDDEEEKISNLHELKQGTSRKLRGFDDEEVKISNLHGLNQRPSRGFDDEEEKILDLQDLNQQTSRKLRGFHDEMEEISNLRDLNQRPSRKSRGLDAEEEKISTLQEKFSNSVSNWLEIEGRKLKEIKIKSDSRTNKKSYSPRTECKIRALEEMKKSKSRTRTRSKTRKKKEQVLEKNTIFDSFAVVKSSYNPQKDFRESMVEMIRERGIEKAEDLEKLLACYLTLNCDDYHDLIIKVFRQVWFELKGVYFDH